MRLKNDEKIILQILKFAPALFIIIMSFTITYYISIQHLKDIESQKLEIKKEYIKENKERIKKNVNTISKYIDNEYSNGLNSIKEEISLRVRNAHGIIETIYNHYKDKKSKEEISELIKEVLRSVRFNNHRGYFFIYERSGKNILNSEFPSLEGKNLWDYKDLKGTYLLQEMFKILENKDETFFTWYWKESRTNNIESEKLGFFKKFEKYDWFLGTGEYISFYEKEIEDKILNHLKVIEYSDEGYVFVIKDTGDLLLSQHKIFENKNIMNDVKYKDVKNSMLKYNNSNITEGYVQYKTTFLEKEVEKISFVRKIKQNDWIVGVGFDFDNVNSLIMKKQKELENENSQYLKNLITISIFLTIVLLLVSYFISKYVERLFLKYKKRVDEKNQKLIKAHQISKIAEWELDLNTMQANWSNSIRELLGVDKDVIVGPEYLKTIMHEDDWNCFESSLTNCIKNKVEHSCNYRIIRPKDKKILYIDCRGELTKNNKIVGTIQDVTDRKIIELENERKEAIIYQQSKMATMGEMIGNIAHQWKQPLNLISLSNGMLKINQEIDSLNTKEELAKAVENIDNSVKHLTTTIDDFRNFFRPEKNEKQYFKISRAIEKSLKLVSSQIESKNIEIIQTIDDIEIQSVENQLVQIFINLFNNAKDELVLKDLKRKLIFVNVRKVDNSTIVEIYDNAGGIPNDIIGKVFQAYFTTKEKTGGTGIGLYMSQEIAQKILNSKILVENKEYEFENEKYKGAFFSIVL